MLELKTEQTRLEIRWLEMIIANAENGGCGKYKRETAVAIVYMTFSLVPHRGHINVSRWDVAHFARGRWKVADFGLRFALGKKSGMNAIVRRRRSAFAIFADPAKSFVLEMLHK